MSTPMGTGWADGVRVEKERRQTVVEKTTRAAGNRNTRKSEQDGSLK